MKRAKIHRRLCFAGKLHAGRLTTRGCRTTITDATGEFLRDLWEPSKAAWLNLGDAAIISNARLDVDEVALVEVIAMDRGGVPTVAVRHGRVSDGAVHVMRVKA